MARKRYILDFVIDSQQAEAAARRLERSLQGVEGAARRAGSAMGRAYSGGVGGPGGAAGPGGRPASAGQLQGIEDRYFKADYDRRARWEGRKQQLAATAAQRLGAIEDRYAKDDYSRRTRFEAAKIREAERAAATSAKQAKSDADRLNAIQDRYTKDDYSRRTRFEASKIRESDRAAATSARQAAADADRLNAIQDRYTKRDYDQRVAAERRRTTQKEREGKQLQAIEDRYLREEYRRRVQYQAQLDRDAEAALAKREQAIVRTAAVVGAAAVVGLNVLTESYRKIREDAVAAAEATTELRRGLRVEAALEGQGAPTDAQLLKSTQFRAATGLGASEASDFYRQYVGSVNIGLQKEQIKAGSGITQKVADDLMVQAGIRAGRMGGSPYTAGELAGLLGQFGPIKSVESGLGQLEAIRMALVEGRGDDTPLTQQLLKASGSLAREGGPVPSLPEMAALIGTTSLTAGPEEAGTRAEQLVRGLRAGLTRTGLGRGAKVPQATFLKGLGITENDTLEQSLGKLMPHLQQQQAAGRDIEVYLGEHGFRSFEERRALVELAGNYDVFKLRMQKARETAAGGAGAAAVEQNKAFLGSAFGRGNVADAMKQAQTVTRGLRGESLRAYMKEAEASPEFMAAEQSVMASLGNRLTGLVTGNFTVPVLGAKVGSGDAAEEGRQYRLLGIAGQLQRKRALAAGVTEQEITGAAHQAYRAGAEYTPEFFRLMDDLILKHGGSAAADTAPAMDALKTAVDENTRVQKQILAKMPPAPPVGAPAPRALPPGP